MRTLGRWAIGFLDDGRGTCSVLQEPGSVAVACGRIDGMVSTPELPADDGIAPVETLARVIGARGAAGLADLAADYAFARVTLDGRVFLARDAFGMRPLFWARTGGRLGFASDPTVLVRLGLATGHLDLETIRRYLTFRSPNDDRSALEGVRQVVGGRWVDAGIGSVSRGRWFRPERVAQDPSLRGARARYLFSSGLESSVVSRSRGRRVVLSLSGGRDSGAIAVALAGTGARAAAVTLLLEGDAGSDERGEAAMLAERLGLPWSAVPVAASATPQQLERAVRVMGATAFPAFPLALAAVDAAVAGGADVLMDGAGGEPLFSASPIVVGDLLRRGRLSDALACAASYDREWTYDTRTIMKTLVRAATPRPLLRVRERIRRTIPGFA